MSKGKQTVLLGVAALFLAWAVCNLGRISADEDWLVRLVLGGLFAFLIIIRPKPGDRRQGTEDRRQGTEDRRQRTEDRGQSGKWLIPLAGAGALLALAGIVFEIHQFEWLGIVLLLYTCLKWALPAGSHTDILLAVFLVYWIHPLPGQVFGRLQVAMQGISVCGAEWLLHCVNERVWADGMILHTGLRVFGVPESCSGMRTVVTVLLCTLGVGILMRLRWYAVLVFLVLGLVQVMALNVLRISFMVLWADRMPVGWGETFLHDTLGIFLLVSILLVQMEVSWWRVMTRKKKKIIEGIEKEELEAPERASMLPVFWQYFFQWGKVVLAVLLIVLAVAFAFFKRRPYHRAMMIYDVVEGLMETDPESAERGIDRAIGLAPGERMLRARKVEILVMRNKPKRVLEEIDKLGGGLDTVETAMKSWALMCLGRTEEAVVLIEGLPIHAQSLPGVAIIKAEYAAFQDNPGEVQKNVVIAAQSASTLKRRRKLFLYLAMHEMWDTVAKADDPEVPYDEFAHALIAVEAQLNVGSLERAARAMENALGKWPDDIRLLKHLFELARRKRGGDWEDVFSARLTANIDMLDADRLAGYIDYCFQLKRPDLAWLAYARLRHIDSEDPMLYMAPVQYGRRWFSFRRHTLGLGGGARDMIDMKPFYLLTKDLAPFASFWARVPLAEELCFGSGREMKARYMEQCLGELREREKKGRLSRRMHKMYPTVLAMSGKFDEAHEVLSEVAGAYPDMRKKSLLKHAEYFSWEEDWDSAYEELRKYHESERFYSLEAEVMYANVLMNLNLGLCAMEVVDRAGRSYPESVEVRQLEGLIWNAYGFKEDALHVLEMVRDDTDHRVIMQLLYDTGRYRDAEHLSKVCGHEPVRTDDIGRGLRIVPAEAAIAPLWPVPLTDAQMDAEADRIEEQARARKSEFLRNYDRLTADWYRARGIGSVSDASAWEKTGRDRMEKAAALNQLTVLLVRQKERAGAYRVTRRALEFLPRSAMLHRILIALSDGEGAVIEEARRMCPDDPEIWLASLVSRCSREEDKEGLGDRLESEMKRVVDSGRYHAGALTRAGDLFLRKGLARPAVVLAKHIIASDAGYLPGYVLGMRSALEVNDMKWALRCAVGGAEHSQDATPFYRMLVMLKSLTDKVDSDMIKALEYLNEHFPHDPKWTEGLGYAYFERGDTARSLRVFSRLLKKEKIEIVAPGSLMLAAEAARREYDPENAVRILKAARDLHPNNFKVLNNLVYNLAQDRDTLEEARELLSRLLEIAGDEFIVYDTAAVVYMKSGQLGVAKRYMKKALDLLDVEDDAALEVRLNSAEIMFRLGQYDEAEEVLRKIRRSPDVPGLLGSRAMELLGKIERVRGKR